MRKTSFIFAGIMSAIIGNAYAVGENTVASKAYVDTKQVKIPVAGTNASTPGESVVTYTDTAGTIGERGFFNYETSMDKDELAEGHEGDIITAADYVSDINVINDDIKNMGDSITNIQNSVTNNTNSITDITNQMNAETRESISVPSLSCANQDCTLYQVSVAAGIAHKLYSCTAQTVATACPSCGTGAQKACENDICTCNVCKSYEKSASSASQCCSGYLISGNKCGCSTNAECVAWLAEQKGVACPGSMVCNTSTHMCGCNLG